MMELFGEAFKAQPVVLALLVLLVFGLTILAGMYLLVRSGLIEKLFQKRENESEPEDTGDSLRTRVATELMTERLSMQRDIDTIKTDLVLHNARFNSDYRNLLEDRGRRLHELANVLNVLKNAEEPRRREMEEMKQRLGIVERQQQDMALDMREVKVDTRYTKEKADELCDRLERIEKPILDLVSRKGGQA